jgi:DNA-binding response OmpR family regulator/DNA-binding CsgD family transcriptional regulator
MAEVLTDRRDAVLVVDDAPENLSLLTDTLDQAGYTVLIAIDGETALELVNQITPDLVLMDAIMPGIGGFETCRRLKREKLLSDLPVIFMTGLSETEHVLEGLSSGGVDYVTKPIELDQLLARIRVHLGNARAAYESRAALDASGRFLLASNRAGQVLWCTPRVRQLLSGAFVESGAPVPVVPSAVIERLLALRRSARGHARTQMVLGGRQFECSLLSSLGPDELLFRLSETGTLGDDQAILRQSFGLTGREAEVLLWISRGKANRDIGEILEISPRTVNKHLEQVFIKLGVENRAAAAGVAIRRLRS